MLHKKHVKEFHGTEFVFDHPQLGDEGFNSVVLCEHKVGTSFKPYPKDGAERQRLIKALAKNVFGSYLDPIEEATNLLDKPDFCFAFADWKVPVKAIRDTIKKKIVPEKYRAESKNHSRPRCPFAK